MYHAESKYRLTRKPHTCSECNKIIAPKSMAYWFKSVVFKESDVGRNCWNEAYVCAECDEKLRDEISVCLER